MDALICASCRSKFDVNSPIWKCPVCGGLLDLEFSPRFDLETIRARRPTIWRYREALPILEDQNILTLGEGFTPLVRMVIHGKTLLVKQDSLFPSGSYKDRGAAVLVSKIQELGVKTVVEDSSGNAGCAIAAYCARAGIVCHIYVPVSTSPGKLAQIQSYGAVLHKIPGSREDTAAAVLDAARMDYYASHSWNPFFFHGTKTFAFEIWEQLGCKAPDTLVLPVGNGTLLLGAVLGFKELLQAGLIDRPPKIVGVQAAGCAPLAEAFERGLAEPAPVEKRETLAEGIAIANPIRGKQILEAVRKSSGSFITVEETEIIEALHLSSRQGIYIEPTAAATLAGAVNYLQKLDEGENMITVITGHGLKSAEKLMHLLAHE